MAGSDKRRLLGNFIVLAFLLVALGLSFLGEGDMNTVALEQHPRCTREEHIHTNACYSGEFLLCGKKAHTHGENCYPILLSENDINEILEWLDSTDDKSMEGIVTAMLERYRPGSKSDTTSSMTAEEIQDLNRDIAADDETPALRFNEHLLNATNLYLDQDVITVLSVGDQPSTDTRTINFYIRLDGRITFVSSRTLSYYYYGDYAYFRDIVSSYTDHVRTNIANDKIASTYYFAYNTTGQVADASQFTQTPTYATTSNRYAMFERTNTPRYALLSKQEQNKLVPVDFYTVEMD